jgi:hypothetical protein
MSAFPGIDNHVAAANPVCFRDALVLSLNEHALGLDKVRLEEEVYAKQKQPHQNQLNESHLRRSSFEVLNNFNSFSSSVNNSNKFELLTTFHPAIVISEKPHGRKILEPAVARTRALAKRLGAGRWRR